MSITPRTLRTKTSSRCLFAASKFQLLSFLLMAFSLFIIAGGPLMVLQGIAWTRMVHEYGKHDTFANALHKTFSGQHRCSLCKKIAEAKSREQKTTISLQTDKSLKASLCSQWFELDFLFGSKIIYFQTITLNYRSIIQEPPEPYPQAV